MHRAHRLTVRIAIGAVVASSASAALAATPTGGTWTSPGEGGAGFTVKGSTIGPVGQAPRRFITAPSNFRCNSANLVVKTSSIAIHAGKFRYDGHAYVDYFRGRKYLGRLIWTGSFTSATSVKGTYRFISPVKPPTAGHPAFVKQHCDSGTHSWTGTQGIG
jgi:hypothetical protein